LENNGKNLKEIYFGYANDSLNSSLAKFCPNLKTLYTIFKYDEVETLKLILHSCQHLESIEVWCGDCGHYYLSKLLKVVVEYSPKEFYDLRIGMYFTDDVESECLSEELEPVFMSWSDRKLQKPLSLMIINKVIRMV